MVENDFQDFLRVLDDAFSINPKWSRLDARGKGLFFKALEPYSLQTVRLAITAHIRDPQRGQFQPTPADIVAQVENNQTAQRPGVEEAWALSFPCTSEDETVVWTEEMRDAFAICKPLYDSGDTVAARMAFKDAYNRIVSQAVRAGRAVKWELSAGHNPEKRALVIEQATSLGRIPEAQASLLLPPPVKAKELDRSGLERLKAEVAKLVPGSVKAQQRREAEAQAERERIAKRKQELSMQASAHA